MTVTKIPLRKAWYAYGHGPLIFFSIYHRGQYYYKKCSTFFKASNFVIVTKHTLHLTRKRPQEYYKKVVLGNYFVIISAGMV